MPQYPWGSIPGPAPTMDNETHSLQPSGPLNTTEPRSGCNWSQRPIETQRFWLYLEGTQWVLSGGLNPWIPNPQIMRIPTYTIDFDKHCVLIIQKIITHEACSLLDNFLHV